MREVSFISGECPIGCDVAGGRDTRAPAVSEDVSPENKLVPSRRQVRQGAGSHCRQLVRILISDSDADIDHHGHIHPRRHFLVDHCTHIRVVAVSRSAYLPASKYCR